ncbi:MAG: hypothetical protein QOJ62_1450 [Actinomycetota bacterium]|nr:hypothetical protein [Actinomycetota bacterium]
MLAVSVLSDIDIVPGDDGLVLQGLPPIALSYDDVSAAIGDADPDSQLAHRRLQRWLTVRRAVAERSLDELAETIRPVGLPVGHELHPGPAWVRQAVLGGCLDLGIGFVGLNAADPDLVVVTPPSVLAAAGVDPTSWWRGATEYLENMGALATARWRREARSPLRPMGDCDVITLLASAVFRGALCADAGGMRAMAAPMRHRGWLDLSRIDPAFALTAAALTDDASRGFERPVLLTVDEVVMVPEGGRPAEIVLRDAAGAEDRWLRDVLYH